MLVESGGGNISFPFELPQCDAVLGGQVVVPSQGGAFECGVVVGYELSQSVAEHTGRLMRCFVLGYGVEGVLGRCEEG